MASRGSFKFAIDRGGTFTDVFAECPDNSVRVMKLLSVDPKYEDDIMLLLIREANLLAAELGKQTSFRYKQIC